MTVGDMDDMRDTLIKLFVNRPCEKMTPWSKQCGQALEWGDAV